MAFERPIIPYADPSFSRMPERGDALSDLFGGPTPWQMELRDWALSGQATPRRMFPGAGRIDAATVLPLAPITPLRRFDELPTAKPPPQPGLAETLMRGAGMLFSSWAGEEHSQNFGNILGSVGSIFDFPFKQVGPIPLLPGSADPKEVFDKLPDNELKLAYDQAILSDPVNASLHIADYLEIHKNDVATMMGVARTTGMVFKPADSLASQLSNIIFGGLFAAGDAVARTYVGSGVRDVENTILNADIDTLPDELKHIRGRYEQGDITYDQMLDDITTSRWRWHQDDSVAGALLSFGLDIVTDPLVIGSFGAGAVKGASNGAIRSAYAATSRAIETRGLRGTAETAIRNSGREVTTQRLYEWAQRNAPAAIEDGLATMSRRQRAIVRAEPIIAPAYSTLDAINNPFRWLGVGKVKEAVSSGIVHGHSRGWAQRLGARNVASMKGLFGDDQRFFRLMGVNIFNNVTVPIYVKSMVGRLKNADESYRSVKGIKPVDEVRTMLNMDDGHIRAGISATDANMERRLPKTSTGKAALEAADASFLDELVQDLSRVSGSPDAKVRAWLGKSRERWALAHSFVYSADGIDFSAARRSVTEGLGKKIDARKAAGQKTKKLEAALKRNESLTLVSQQNLTHQRAEQVMAAIAAETDPAKKAAMMREAIERFDQLDQFADQLWDDATLIKEFGTFVQELIDRGRLVQEADPRLIDPSVRSVLGNTRYIAGFAPEDPWGIIHDDAGRVVGSDIFVDFVDDVDPERYVSKFGLRDRGVMVSYLRGIHGSLHYMKARDRFVRTAVQDLGLTARQARDVFEVVQREGIKQGHGPRSMTNEAAYALASEALEKVDAVAAAKLEARGLIEAMVRSWEGQLMDVGITSKISGIIKSAYVARTNNLVGRISESLYPNMRFMMNPQFLGMELAEGPFFALLRGVRLGIRRTADDIRLDSILDTTYDSTVRYNEQLERMQVAHADANVAAQAQRELSRLGRRGAQGNILDGPRLLHSRGGLFDYKRQLYVRDWGKRSAKAMRENYMKYAPEAWREWEIALGTGDPEKIFMRIAEERGMYSPNKRHMLHLMDAAKPRGLGRREPIRVGDIALLNGFDSTVQFRQAARDGTFTRHQFVQRYNDVGITNTAYIDDAWRVVSGFTEDEFMTAFKEVFPESVGVGDSVRTLPDGSVVREHRERFAWENIWNTHMATARLLRLSPEEYLNRRFNSLPSYVDEALPVPAGSLTQKMRGEMDVAREAWGTKVRTFPSQGPELLSRYVPDFDSLWPTLDQLGYEATLSPPGSLYSEEMFMAVVRAIPSSDELLGELAGMSDGEISVLRGSLRDILAYPKAFESGVLPLPSHPPRPRLLLAKLGGLDATLAQRYVKQIVAPVPGDRAVGRTISGAPKLESLSQRALLSYGDAGAIRLGEIVERGIRRRISTRDDAFARPLAFDSGRRVSVAISDVTGDATDTAEYVAAMLRSDVAIHTPIELADDVVAPEGVVRGVELDISPSSILLEDQYRAMLEKWLTQKGLQDFDFIASGTGIRAVWGGNGTLGDLLERLPEETLAKLRDGSWVDEVDQDPPPLYADLAHVLQTDASGRDAIGAVQKEVARFDGPIELERLRYIVWRWAGGGGDVETPRGNFEQNLAGLEYDPTTIALVDIIASAPRTDKTLYRGVRIDTAGIREFMGDYQPGMTVDYNFASWTSDAGIAHGFSGGSANGASAPVVFMVTGPSQGIFRAGLSGITSEEREFITQGRFRVISNKYDPDMDVTLIEMKQESVFSSRRLEPMPVEPRYQAFSREIVGDPLRPPVRVVSEHVEMLHPFSLAHVPKGNTIDWGKVATLRRDMEERGYVGNDPIQLTYRQADSTVIVDEGNHRLLAAKQAGITEVPVTVFSIRGTDHRKGLRVGRIANEDGYVPGQLRPTEVMELRHPMRGDESGLDAGGNYVGYNGEWGRLFTARDEFEGYLDNETVGGNLSHELKSYVQDYQLDGGGPLRLSTSGDTLYQRDPSGAVRAYVKLDADDRAALRVVEGKADASTAIHEAAHIFSRDLDPSARSVVIGEHNRATGSYATAWTRTVEEWFADEYIAFAAREHAPNSRTAAIFRGFNEWAHANGIGDKGSVLDKFFEDVFEGDYASIPKSFWDADAQRVWDVSRTVLLRNEEAVHKTSYYSRSRNIIERSLNHPYLGLYPASYMWGKVLPELIHFLVKEPFGLSAPMGGAMLVGHVWRNVQWQLQVSEDMREFVDENPALINILQMVTPGTPWELPAVTPVVMRRAQERALENEVRKLQGKEPLKAAPLDWTSDMMTYAFGLTQMARRIQDVSTELSAWQRGDNATQVPNYPWLDGGPVTLTQDLIDWERDRNG